MKSKRCCPMPIHAICLVLAAAVVSCAETGKTKSEQPMVDQAGVTLVEEKPAEPDEILMRMARFLAGTQRFSVKLDSNYDVVQESGQKIEFGETRSITLSRPNGLRVAVERSDGEKHLVLYDGQNITVYDSSKNVYAQTAKPGGIDEAVMYFLRDLHMHLPLAVLLVSRFPEEIESRTLSLAYVESTVIYGFPADHLAGRTETVDYQVWVEKGGRPLPLRVVLTYKNAEGQPQFRARFSNWNLAPKIPDRIFVFDPPQGAHKIAFLAELPKFGLKGNADTEKSGEPK